MLLLNLTNRKLARTANNKYLWQWINIIFNKVDEDRRKKLGPDRTCAEWLLRNGGKVKWKGVTEYLDDYNHLPPESTKAYIEEVDASSSSIMHYGFTHFEGCKHIAKIILHDCGYLEDKGLSMMKPLQNQLKYLQVSKCLNISASGLRNLSDLTNLETLVIFNLPYIKNKEEILKELQSKLPKCAIDFK